MHKRCYKSSNNQIWFTNGHRYIGIVEEEHSLYAMDNNNDKCYIAASHGGLWHTDEWFSEHFIEDKKMSYELNKVE